MKIEHVTIGDDLAAVVDELWPHCTWSEVVEYALALAVEYAQQTDTDNEHAQDAAGQSEPPGSSDFETRPVTTDSDDLEQRIADAFSGVTA